MSLAVPPNSNQFTLNPVKGMLTSSPNFNILDVELDPNSTLGVFTEKHVFKPSDPVILDPNVISSQILIKKVSIITENVFGIIIDDTKTSEWSNASRRIHLRVAFEGAIIYLETDEIVPRGSKVRVKTAQTTDANIPQKYGVSGAGTIVGTALDRASASGELIRVFIQTPLETFFLT